MIGYLIAQEGTLVGVINTGETVVGELKTEGVLTGTMITYGSDLDLELPDGYAMETGIYVPSEDISDEVVIDLKNAYRWNDDENVSTCHLAIYAVDVHKGMQAAGAGLNVRFETGRRMISMVTTPGGTSTSSFAFIMPDTTSTFRRIRITGSNSYPLKAGVTYLWVVIGELAE